MRYLDVHAHMWMLKENEQEIGEECKRRKVSIINCGVDYETNNLVLNSPYYKALGWWPGYKGDIKEIKKQIMDNECIAIGEIGLDYYWSEKKELMIKQFEQMLETAKEKDKPIIVHSRRAEDDVIKVLKNYDLKIVMHAFTGSTKTAIEGINRGYYFSIPTIVVRSEQLQKIVELTPKEQLLSESDTPYLSAVKGERNTPLTMPLIIKKINEIKQENCERTILKNSIKMFKV